MKLTIPPDDRSYTFSFLNLFIHSTYTFLYLVVQGTVLEIAKGGVTALTLHTKPGCTSRLGGFKSKKLTFGFHPAKSTGSLSNSF